MGGFHDTDGQFRQTKTSYIPLPIFAFAEADATALAAFGDGASPTPGFAVDDSEAVGIRWNDHANPDPVATGLVFPADRKPGTDVIVHVVASKTGATVGDATTFDVGVFFQPTAALRDADANAGGATDAMDGDATSKTVQKVTRTIASADIPDGPVPMTLTLQPTDGTLGTDDVTVHAVYLEYEKIHTPEL
jgi:hypothetical protein